jgi:hypothetical protein
VQHDPHGVGLIEAHLDEVVSRSERAELTQGLVDQPIVELGARSMRLEPTLGRGGDARLLATHAGRNRRCNRAEHRLEGVGKVVGRKVGANSGHTAADVDADRRG